MLIRLVVFALFVLLLAYGFSWLADRPSDLSLIWEGQIYQTRLIVAASAIIALIAAVMIAWWFVRLIWTSPYSVTRYFRARKRDRGYQALSTGLIAVYAPAMRCSPVRWPPARVASSAPIRNH